MDEGAQGKQVLGSKGVRIFIKRENRYGCRGGCAGFFVSQNQDDGVSGCLVGFFFGKYGVFLRIPGNLREREGGYGKIRKNRIVRIGKREKGERKMITNPILRGFHPDASVCVAGEDYYIATSTFEWWPGVMIYHSRDLVNWRLAGRPLNRKSQISLVGDRNSGGIWAPHLSWAKGRFWLMITDVKTDQCFKDTLNYVMSCESIDGEWTDPVYVHGSGFDPALFHDDDGRSYVMSMLWDYRPYKPNFNGVAIQEYDLWENRLLGEETRIFAGSGWGLTEGPQILKKDGWYYLLCAEGGTGFSHASVVCRSRSLTGPYEISPYTPLISTRFAPDSPLQKCGHASFLKSADGKWYITYICARPLTLQRGNCVLGRETGIAELEWVEDWPRLKNGEEAVYLPAEGGRVKLPDREIVLPEPPVESGWNRFCVPPVKVSVPAKNGGGRENGQQEESWRKEENGKQEKNWRKEENGQQEDFSTETDFDGEELPEYFQTLREPLGAHMSLSERPGFLRLYGQQSIASLHSQTMVARRWQSVSFVAGTVMEFNPVNYNQMAGLTCFYNTENYMYAYVSWDEDRNCRILDILVCSHGKTVVELGENQILVPKEAVSIRLRVRVDRERLQFYYEWDKEPWRPLGRAHPADHLSDDYIRDSALVFTGAMVGICVQDLYDHKGYADFDCFYYREG